jgi:uncharacterized protein (DUF488 family)
MHNSRTLHTIGHSNHAIEAFINLFITHNIETVIDVRSWPRSRRLPHFNRAALEQSLRAANINYLWFGKELGGKAGGNENPEAFHARIGEVAQTQQAAIMCAEEDPLRCHRKLLLAKPLIAEGVELLHIRGVGSVITDEALSADKDAQLSPFAED